MGMAFLLQSRIDAAVVWLERACSAVPEHPYYRSTLASALAVKGETARATTELAEARRLASDDRYSSLARLRAVANWGEPNIRALFEATYFSGLRLAGMPEE
jgi:predicted Zn-dependent protease